MIALYFDGRRDETTSKEIVNGKSVRITIQEVHISLVEQPNSTYFGHVTPDSGSGKDIVSSILKFMKEMMRQVLKLLVLMVPQQILEPLMDQFHCSKML
ncbi:hypothetical protein AVEN_247074-1 [Araneus ventricosus]|uniref:Uncharacterized protein n=1 Tax=Araneus ventricosus TaxID=182803 RepID=A0A4Y2HSP5_ARAVE|nr:hypothetical protein AVEN_247074-1 [Araneus ventricosus]